MEPGIEWVPAEAGGIGQEYVKGKIEQECAKAGGIG